MAYIEERPGGWLVIWRDAETGRKRSRTVKWGGSPDTAGGVVTKDDARVDAESLRARMRQKERAYKKPLERVMKQNAQDGFVPMWSTGRPDADQFRFATYLRTLLEADPSLKESTREAYEIAIRNHFDGTDFGQQDVRAISADDVVAYWSTVKTAHRRVWQLLAQTFNYAVRRGHITASPLPRTAIKAPTKGRQKDIKVLSVNELEGLASAAKFERDRLMILILGYGGLRAGEVGGLRVEDIDTVKCRLRLRQQVIRLHTGRKITSLKTGSSRRTVPIPCSLAEELLAFIVANPPAKDGRIFHAAKDGLLAHQAVNNAVQRAALAAGMRKINAHLLRHTAVSLLVDDGANIKAVQAFCGHARIQETLDTYGHLFDYGADALGESMERRREKYRNGDKVKGS